MLGFGRGALAFPVSFHTVGSALPIPGLPTLEALLSLRLVRWLIEGTAVS